MKTKLKIYILLFAICLFNSSICRAAFPIRYSSTQPSVTITDAKNTILLPTIANNADINNMQSISKSMQKTQVVAPDLQLTQFAYILLAILGLGWLAIGINDEFLHSRWIFALFLYLLLYIPGLIYTFLRMDRYY